MILVTFRTIALGAALTTVTEWRSQDFTHLGGFEFIMLAAFGFALCRGVTLPCPLRLLEECRIGATLFAPSTPAVALLDRLPDWPRLRR
jgi:hypothetical protein